MSGKICTFFGHRDSPASIIPMLDCTLRHLIIHENVDRFYVGKEGQFDNYVRCTLRLLQNEYPHIDYAVVLAQLPEKADPFENDSDTLFPEELESIHSKYAIYHRNQWMMKHADFVIAYISHSWGGAAHFIRKAQRQRKTIINLATKEPFHID